MRKLFISADIEGCAGVASQHAMAPDRWEWPSARKWMTGEVCAAALAALEAGFEEVIVADGHGNAHNIIPDDLPDGVRLVRSWPRPYLQMEGVQDPDVEGCFFVGYHNGSAAEGGVLAHTYHGAAFRDLRVNGVSCSEGYLNAALAGEYGRPVLLVTGDRETCLDAERYAAGGARCVVKEALGWRAQSSMTPREAQAAIRRAATEALAGPAPAPFRLEGPLAVDFEMTTRVAAELLAYLPGVTLADAYTARVTLPSVREVMRFTAFAMFWNPTGAIAL